MTDAPKPFAALTARIVGAFVGKNPVSHAELGPLISTVHSALKRTAEPAVEAVDEAVRATAAQIRKSITPDALISFLDRKPYKTLKRHLTRHGLTVADYKAKFGLPKDYPTTAPSYSERRSAMAKAVGLGQGGRKVAGAPARSGRPKKAPPQTS
ncbi:MAG: transcriptional regulator [Caulobacteraceae bacterium]|nr:transcriptional regulator [Caulobacteraceae bacterium]